MKTSLFLVSLLFGGTLLAQTATKADLSNSLLKKFNEESKQNTEAPPISFIENKGQIHDQNYKPRPDVLFGAMAGNMTFHLKTTGVSYQLTRVDSYKEVEDLKTKQTRKEIDQQIIYRVDLSWLNANTNLRTTTDQTLEGYNNYYLENCPNGALNVKSYSGVTLHNLYNGVNLHYYEKEGQLKHDYIVAPGANYKQIQLKVEGAEVRINEDGSLTLNTPLGKIQEGAPIVYQNGKQLKAKWVVSTSLNALNKTEAEGTRRLSFEIENYNPKQELIIDPVTRLWGTYYGGDGGDRGQWCSTDAAENVYMAGATISDVGTVIATVGAHQSVNNITWDAFLVKFNSGGVRQWGTYYGGTGSEEGYSGSIDASGNVYMAGHTNSNTFSTLIATAGAHQTTNAGNQDAFLVKFNSSGVRQWGTYYGGSGYDYGYSCATDPTGNIYLTGESNTFSAALSTAGAHQLGNGGGIDCFLVKFNSSGVRQWATYYGGTANDEGNSCSLDASGNVYLTGLTNSTANIATGGAHQTVYGGATDGFLVKFNSSGVRQWGTYYGGAAYDQGNSCVIDATGNLYFVGYTASSIGTSIASAGSHQAIYGGGTYDAFLAKFNSSGVRQWGTYYGGVGFDVFYSCIINAAGSVYVSGETESSTGISSPGAFQAAIGGGDDGLLAKFNSSGVRQWGTYYGGQGNNDVAKSCAVSTANDVYFSGYTNTSTGNAIATAGAHQTVNGGSSSDAFLVKFSECSGPISATVNQTACNSYTWPLNGTTYTSSTNTPSATLTTSAGCDSVVILNLTINTVDVSVVVANQTITANSAGANYQWINCNSGNAIIPGATAQSFTPSANGNYAVIVTNTNCTDTSACQVISSVGIDEIAASDIEVYPNPTSGTVKVILGEQYPSATIQLINALGQAVLHKTYSSSDEITFEIEGAPGVYFLKVESAEQVLGRIRVVKN